MSPLAKTLRTMSAANMSRACDLLGALASGAINPARWRDGHGTPRLWLYDRAAVEWNCVAPVVHKPAVRLGRGFYGRACSGRYAVDSVDWNTGAALRMWGPS